MPTAVRHQLIVHDLAQALTAARVVFGSGAAAGDGTELRLFSPPGAALYLGSGYWRALALAVAAEYPGYAIEAILDCADDAGAVLAALGDDITLVRFTGAAEVAAKLADIAAKRGARLIGDPLPDLDLGRVDDAATACRLAFGRI